MDNIISYIFLLSSSPTVYEIAQYVVTIIPSVTFKRRIKSHLPFAGIIRSSQYSPHFQDKG